MKYVGAHVSISGGVENAPINAQKIDATAFGMFTKNQRQWNAKPLTEYNINSFKINLTESKISPDHVVVHDSYLINIGSPKYEAREKSIIALIDEAKRVEQLGLTKLVLHPGSHLKQITEKKCIELIGDAINTVLQVTESAELLLETTAGQGSNIGYTFNQLQEILSYINNLNRVGICLDTCHIFSAGYNLEPVATYNDTMALFEKTIGFKFLKAVHLNDSKNEINSKKDRHESIGDGYLGIEPFKYIMQDTRFENIPMILETPNNEIWKDEIKLLYSFA